MTEESNKYDAERKEFDNDELRFDRPRQPESLFSREVLEPLYNEWYHFHNTGSNTAYSFFIFLLKQNKKNI